MNRALSNSRAVSDIMVFLRGTPAFAERLAPIYLPFDDFALEADFYQQPITQEMQFAESAGRLQRLAAWIRMSHAERVSQRGGTGALR